jgi:hypothetical protein
MTLIQLINADKPKPFATQRGIAATKENPTRTAEARRHGEQQNQSQHLNYRAHNAAEPQPKVSADLHRCAQTEENLGVNFSPLLRRNPFTMEGERA